MILLDHHYEMEVQLSKLPKRLCYQLIHQDHSDSLAYFLSSAKSVSSASRPFIKLSQYSSNSFSCPRRGTGPFCEFLGISYELVNGGESLPPEHLSHSWIMIAIHLPGLSSMFKYNSTLLGDDLTDFTLPHVHLVYILPCGDPIIRSSQLDASNAMFRASLLELFNCHFISLPPFYTFFLSSRAIHLRSEHSEQDLGIH